VRVLEHFGVVREHRPHWKPLQEQLEGCSVVRHAVLIPVEREERGLLEEIHNAGNTIIVVTHEEDIARHAHRIIRLIDGNVASDEKNENIRTMDYYNDMTPVK
jgi:hypothetical protein